jgi:hypothetical protein
VKEFGLLLPKLNIDTMLAMLTVKALGMKLVQPGMDKLASQKFSTGITLSGTSVKLPKIHWYQE